MNGQAGFIGVDVGGTHVRIGLFCDGALRETRRVPRREALPDEEPARLGDFIAAYARDCAAPVRAVGVGVPGTLSRDCRRVLKVSNIPALDGLALASLLEARARLPVFLENDTVMLLTGDLRRLALDAKGLVLGVYIGTGLGGALFYDGRPLKGRNGVSELGHIPMLGRTERCTCGNIGCAENYVSGRCLQALRARLWPDTPISGLFEAMAGSGELAAYIDALGVVLGGAATLLDPEYLLIGGGVAGMAAFPKAAVEAAVRERTMKPQPSEGLRILWTEDDGASGVLGAACYAANAL